MISCCHMRMSEWDIDLLRCVDLLHEVDVRRRTMSDFRRLDETDQRVWNSLDSSMASQMAWFADEEMSTMNVVTAESLR